MISVLSKLRSLLSRQDRVRVLLLIALLIGVALAEMAGIASIMPFMAVVTNPEVVHSNSLLREVYQRFGIANDATFMTFLGAMVLTLLVCNNAAKALSTWLSLRFQNRLVYTISRRLLARYMARPYSYFLHRNSAELGNTLVGEVGRVVAGVLSPVMDIASNLLICLAILTLLILVDPLVALAIATVLGGSYSLIYLLARRNLARISRQQVEANASKYKYAGEALGGIKDLKVLGRELTFLDRYVFFAERHARNNVAAGVIAQLPRYALEIVAFGGILVVVLYLIGQGQQTAKMIPVMALYSFAGYRLLPALQQLFSAITTLRYNTASLDVVHTDLTNGIELDSDAEAALVRSRDATPLPFEHEIELRDVSFGYEGTTEPTLNGLNLKIPVNSSIGFVGPTGCGKTTSVDVIMGLLLPSHGQVLIDGQELSMANLASWQKNIGYVPQQIYISDDTLARNIAFGVPDQEVDMAAVRRAAAIANLAEFVERDLQEGYETRIGERGVRLSGGQRQRIGIARAMYHDPAVLILDEATSALDGITEEYVMEAVHNLSRRKTIIVIAHRLSTVRECDMIYQLDQGTVVSSGTYNDMLHNSEWFRTASGV